MIRRVLGMVVVIVVLANGASAWACFNDTGTEAAEREFRSRYDRPVPVSRAGQISPLAMAMLGAGVLLNVTAVGILVRRRPAKVGAVGVVTQKHAEVQP